MKGKKLPLPLVLAILSVMLLATAPAVQASTAATEAGTTQADLKIVRAYDANRNDAIDRPEAIQAINDYFDYSIPRSAVLLVIAFYFSGDPVGTHTPQSDREALTALYQSTDGQNWLDNSNWLSEEPLDEWHGVTANEDGRVTLLNLGMNRLNGEIAPEVGDLTSLTQLYLNDNQLSGETPTELGNITSLRRLFLQHNQLTGGIPAELGDLDNLERLFLNDNHLVLQRRFTRKGP